MFELYSLLIHFASLHLHLFWHNNPNALQSHVEVAHFPLHLQIFVWGLLPCELSGRAGVLYLAFLLASICSFEGLSFPAKYCSTRDCGSGGSIISACALAFFKVEHWLLSFTTSFNINCTYPKWDYYILFLEKLWLKCFSLLIILLFFYIMKFSCFICYGMISFLP